MDRQYVRQKSINSNASSGNPSSPMMSPMHRHARSGSTGVGNFRKTQNNAAKAAAQRLAQVMAYQPADDDDDDELSFDYNPPSATPSLGGLSGRSIRSRSPALGRNSVEQPQSVRSTSAARPALAVKTVPMVRPSAATPLKPRTSISAGETPRDSRKDKRMSVDLGSPYMRETGNNSSPDLQDEPEMLQEESETVVDKLGRYSVEQPSSARSTQSARPALAVRTVPMVPPSLPISLKPPTSTPGETPRDGRKDRRTTVELASLSIRETRNRSSSALQDELDMLQEENEDILEKLRLAEERFEEAEARAKQLEKQVANLGDGVSLEARLLSRKEAALQQREAALKAAEARSHGVKSEEITSLRLEAETARDEATAAMEQLHEAEGEIKTLRTMTQRMILTTEEMEEVVLKRCWLARYWSLCVKHGIHAEIAEQKHVYWSSFAPLPLEVVLSAGQKAKEESAQDKTDVEARDKLPYYLNDLSGEGNIESMLLVEKGLRELASLKVEDAVKLAMALHRRPNLLKYGQNVPDDLKVPFEGQNLLEAFELSSEESEDVLFKQAWLTYFWRRAKGYGLEQDIADEHLQYWISQSSRTPTSHDAVDVERGLMELRKLGIETRLWEASRRSIDPDSYYSKNTDLDF